MTIVLLIGSDNVYVFDHVALVIRIPVSLRTELCESIRYLSYLPIGLELNTVVRERPMSIDIN